MTLWTAWHLQQLDRVAEYDAVLARFDTAALFATAQYDPEKLEQLRQNYLGQFVPPSVKQASLGRTLQRIAAHRTMRPIPAPDVSDVGNS